MSFGVGFGDLVLASKLARNVYKACKDSGETLHVRLKEAEDYIDESPELDTSRKNRLNILTDGCNTTLEDLQKLLKSYERLGTQAQKTWDRMRFGLEDLAGIRSRLVSNATLLTAFNGTLVNSSTTRIEKKLNKSICEVRAGYREGSVITTPDAVEAIESLDAWGLINEDPTKALDKTKFELEMRKKQAKRLIDEVFKPLTIESVAPSVRKKSITDPTRLIRKLFAKGDALVQAASDGDMDNVNAKDRWGWSALSMCAYGGHLAIARLLLEHGADLFSVDVDGDTPMQIHSYNPWSLGSTYIVVILFDEAQTGRDRLARELRC
ncbi:hypothetical protein F5Y11DRAFT_362629 [Daldinia sp. FL1419]|nr:hypothetical protein F5Y11DRAFT_362629 [Daldinia sp. FL1419]